MPNSQPLVSQDKIEELRQQHIGRLLLRAHRNFSVRASEKLELLGHSGLSLAHTNLIANLDIAGTRITTLAERVGVSKQAIGSLVADLERKGYITRAADAADGRATLITFADAGWQFLQDAHHVKREIEAEYTALLGEAGMQTLRALLSQLVEQPFD